jgi:O-antigen/teichoic acid export membrane protein
MTRVLQTIRFLPLRFKGELFASTFSYGVTSVIRLGSSLILTRLLTPEAYGTFAILLSFYFIIELLSDVGTVGLLIRHPRGGEQRFVHTIWTIRLLRCTLNFCLLFLGAPLIAYLYHAPALTTGFRVLSFSFLLSGAESMSFALAQRDQRARIANYTDMWSSALMTIFVIVMAITLRSYLAFVFGLVLQRALVAVSSYFFYRNIGVGIAFDREAVAAQFGFARLVMPSSMLTLVLSQYDRLILLKLFNFTLLGVYSVASNLVAPVLGIIVHNARVVLYARCSQYFRTDRASARERYYRENHRLFAVGATLAALVAGFSRLIVDVLYDSRYTMAGHILMILGLGAIVASAQNASENLLVASGRTHAVLIGNIVRLCSLVPFSLVGYFCFGFEGFLWFSLLATLAPLIYYYREQRRCGLFSAKEELLRFVPALGAFAVCFMASEVMIRVIPSSWLHLAGKHHAMSR